MSTFLIRSATSQSSSYPIVFTRLGGPRFRSNPHLKFVKVQGIEPATYLMIGRQTSDNEDIYIYIYTYIHTYVSPLCRCSNLDFREDILASLLRSQPIPPVGLTLVEFCFLLIPVYFP